MKASDAKAGQRVRMNALGESRFRRPTAAQSAKLGTTGVVAKNPTQYEIWRGVISITKDGSTGKSPYNYKSYLAAFWEKDEGTK